MRTRTTCSTRTCQTASPPELRRARGPRRPGLYKVPSARAAAAPAGALAPGAYCPTHTWNLQATPPELSGALRACPAW